MENVLCEAQELSLDTLWWTASTVAQTLGGALALVGAFVLFRLQALRRSVEERVERIMDINRVPEGEQDLYVDKKLEQYHGERKPLALAGHVLKLIDGGRRVFLPAKFHAERILEEAPREKELKDSFLATLWPTVLTIVGSLAALVVVAASARLAMLWHWLLRRFEWIPWSASLVLVFAAGYCVWRFAVLIKAALAGTSAETTTV